MGWQLGQLRGGERGTCWPKTRGNKRGSASWLEWGWGCWWFVRPCAALCTFWCSLVRSCSLKLTAPIGMLAAFDRLRGACAFRTGRLSRPHPIPPVSPSHSHRQHSFRTFRAHRPRLGQVQRVRQPRRGQGVTCKMNLVINIYLNLIFIMELCRKIK